MSRSLKKGPYINVSLEKKILAMNESGKKTVVKTWARASMISPDFVGHTVAVHNGNKFIPVYITENMVGHKLGNIRFSSDLDYIYGYIESKGDEDLSMLKNLGIWLDTDGDQSATQGGGWLFTLYKFFDVSVYGEVGENLVWTPGLHSQTSADGEKYGAEVTTGSPAGYGEGSFSASVFKYTFVIDRKVVGLADATKTVVGVNFDNGKGIVGANLTNPDRGGSQGRTHSTRRS